MLENLEPKQSKAEYCKTAQVLQRLDESDAKILNDALAAPEVWSAKGLSTALRERGLSLADTTLSKHRNRLCACYRG